jgi:hypothetical protein
MTQEDLIMMEERLKITLPPAYRDLLANYPWPKSIGAAQLSLFDDAALNIERTLEYRRGYGGAPPWPADYVHIGDDEDACPYAMRCSDGTIVKTDHGNLQARPLESYASVGDFARQVQDWLDDFV